MSFKMRILYVGESWLGSCARSLKEALIRHSNIELDEVSEDLFFPKHRAKWLRGVHRLLHNSYKKELYKQIFYRVAVFKPDFLIVYKGNSLDKRFIQQLRLLGVQTVNVYPDLSPHAHGVAHRIAVGEYDLVISTKPFHRAIWHDVYGYSNICNFVPQGYDPRLHLVAAPPVGQPYDVALVATWRYEYGTLMKQLAELLSGCGVKVAIGGNGWVQRRDEFPADWIFAGELQGRSYINWLRQGKICIAPVTREVLINGVRQPGDEDTTRTYELAAAQCFFIHRRTDFVKTLYSESEEVPFFDTPEELAEKILHYLAHPDERVRMAAQAHRRAVPAYSLDGRVDDIVKILEKQLNCSSSGVFTLPNSSL
jgi:spore maturation protein CgeB